MDTSKNAPEAKFSSSPTASVKRSGSQQQDMAAAAAQQQSDQLNHDRMLQQAIYNTGANVVVVLAGIGFVALYWVLESFFRPLMWAALCGAFLYPFKSRVTKNIKSWLSDLKESGTPFALGMFKLPVDVLDTVSENLLETLHKRWRVIAVVSGVFVTLYITYHQAPMDFRQFTRLMGHIYNSVSNLISFFSFKWVFGLAICYLIAVIKFWSPETKQILSYGSIPIWLLAMFCVIANAGALRLPLAVIVVVLMAVGYYTDQKTQHENDEVDACTGETTSDHTHLEMSFQERFERITSIIRTSFQYSTDRKDVCEPPVDVMVDNDSAVSEQILEDPGHKDHDTLRETESFASTSTTANSELLSPPGVEEVTPVIRVDHQFSTTSLVSDINPQLSQNGEKKRPRSDRYFIFLFWAAVLVLLWSNVWLLLLPLISLAFRLVKMLVNWIMVSTDTHRNKILNSEEVTSTLFWCKQRLDVILPGPVRGMTQLILRGDNKVLRVLLEFADVIITVLLIFLLLVGFLLLSVGFFYHVQKEGIHLVTVTSNLVQNSTNEVEWLTGLFEEGADAEKAAGIHSSLDPMIKNLYSFGREWISTQIAERIGHESSRRLLQTELLRVWDSLYESWVTKNATAIAKPNYDGALFSHIRNGGVELMWESFPVDINGIFSFVRENMGIFQSVMESVWILLKGNVNIAFNLLITLLQIILGGSTAILNSFLSLIVFFTTLFYLLASSCNGYKPVEWISGLTIARTGNKFAQAVEDGIGGVFAASLKMAAFYGVYTWLTHTVFGINIVYLPSAFAAILGAIPFVGTYWAALPAILELSLIHKEVFLAVLLAIFHVLPTFFVDPALYSDIKGGGHPYFTGLAIAGGIYCFGLEGAIVGPVLLCCIIIAMNLYSAIISNGSLTASSPGCAKSRERVTGMRNANSPGQ